MLWSVGINGDNAVDAIVAPIFYQYLDANGAAMTHGQPLPFVTAYGFFRSDALVRRYQRRQRRGCDRGADFLPVPRRQRRGDDPRPAFAVRDRLRFLPIGCSGPSVSTATTPWMRSWRRFSTSTSTPTARR